MVQANLVRSPLLPVVEDVVVVLYVLGEMVSDVVSQGSWIRLRNLGRVGHILVGCPSLSHSVQGGELWEEVELWTLSSSLFPQQW
jgi:hypothetical protein